MRISYLSFKILGLEYERTRIKSNFVILDKINGFHFNICRTYAMILNDILFYSIKIQQNV